MKLVAVPMAQIEQAWLQTHALLKRIVESDDALTMPFLWGLLRSGRGEMWMAGDEASGTKAVAITEMQDWRGETVAFCHGVASDDLRAWRSVIPAWHEALKARGAVRVRAQGRDGWQRAWPGARVVRQVYEVGL